MKVEEREKMASRPRSGKSYFVHDGPTLDRLKLGMHVNDEIWVDDPANLDPTTTKDPVASSTFHLESSTGGSVMCVWTFYPESEDTLGMHTTCTIDYGVVLSGEIDLELDEGTVHLK